MKLKLQDCPFCERETLQIFKKGYKRQYCEYGLGNKKPDIWYCPCCGSEIVEQSRETLAIWKRPTSCVKKGTI